MKKIIIFIILIVLSLSIGISYIVIGKDKKKSDLRIFDIDLKEYDKVMFVAHPDDDLIWGGSHLIDDNYLVVCVTCGARKDRVEEFIGAMNATNDKYIMLDYPDKTNGERDNWDKVYDDIKKDIEKILSLKDWKLIVTHNKDGEYGHIHHKMTHDIVTNIYENNYLENDNLYYFGKYYKKDKIDDVKDELEQISLKNYEKKRDLIYTYYVSQSSVSDGLSHMFRYENWQKYEVSE